MALSAPPVRAVDFNRLQLPLLEYGVSHVGADQFLTGQPVLDPLDRQALLAMVAQILPNSVGLPALDAGSKDPAKRALAGRSEA